MRRLIYLLGGLAFIGCGGENHSSWPGQGPGMSYNFDAAIVNPLSRACENTGSAPLLKMTNTGDYPNLDLEFGKSNGSKDDRLPSNPTTAQRCKEIIDSMLNNAIVDLSFDWGKGRVRPKSAYLRYTNGSLNEGLAKINLRCPEDFLSTCTLNENEKCSFRLDAPVQVCTFRAPLDFFVFSDHEESMIDFSGELDFSSPSSATLKITKLSYMAAPKAF